MEALLITVGRLLRGPVGDVVTDGAVLVRDGRIAAEGARTDVAAAGLEVRRIDLPHSTMLPGLINGHVHLAMDGGPDPVRSMLDSDPRRLAREMALHARQLLDCGVTTVRDLGDRAGPSLGLGHAIASRAV